MKYLCVIWDWNGTLADDRDASLQATNDILARHGKPPITLEQYYSYIDTPISRFYEHLFDLHEVPMSRIGEEFYEFYPRYFDSLQDGAAALVEKLHAAGVRQVILSSAHRENIVRDAGRLGILPYFDDLLAADDLLAESKVDRAKAWIAGQNIPRSRMVMVGDLLHDREVAEAMGTDCILCSFGHQHEQDLLTAGVPLVRSFSELETLLL